MPWRELSMNAWSLKIKWRTWSWTWWEVFRARLGSETWFAGMGKVRWRAENDKWLQDQKRELRRFLAAAAHGRYSANITLPCLD